MGCCLSDRTKAKGKNVRRQEKNFEEKGNWGGKEHSQCLLARPKEKKQTSVHKTKKSHREHPGVEKIVILTKHNRGGRSEKGTDSRFVGDDKQHDKQKFSLKKERGNRGRHTPLGTLTRSSRVGCSGGVGRIKKSYAI